VLSDLTFTVPDHQCVAVVGMSGSGKTTLARCLVGLLSGGERQRVAIARALILEPDLLVCDEVTSALDVSVQAAIVELLRRLQAERGLSMIFITHNLPLVRSIADHVVVMNDGRICERGTVTEVLEAPKDAYTTQLLADVPKMTVSVGEG
jgi:peptide/nickel transport system ATP-binding protein